jgi:hypothetical protein
VLKAIHSLLRPNVVPYHLYSDSVPLTEKSNESLSDEREVCRRVTLTTKQHPTLVLKLDEPRSGRAANDWLFPLFDRTKSDLTCICDYIVFFEAPKRGDRRLFVFLCELKSGNPQGALKQLRNGKIVSDFIVAMARNHRQVQPDSVEYRGMIFSTVTRPSELTVKPKPPGYRADDRMPDLFWRPFRCGIEVLLEEQCEWNPTGAA